MVDEQTHLTTDSHNKKMSYSLLHSITNPRGGSHGYSIRSCLTHLWSRIHLLEFSTILVSFWYASSKKGKIWFYVSSDRRFASAFFSFWFIGNGQFWFLCWRASLWSFPFSDYALHCALFVVESMETSRNQELGEEETIKKKTNIGGGRQRNAKDCKLERILQTTVEEEENQREGYHKPSALKNITDAWLA